MPSFGLIITKENHKSIYLTIDSQYCSPRQIEERYPVVDIIIQDCELIGVNTKFEEGQGYYINQAKEDSSWPSLPAELDMNVQTETMALITQGYSPIPWERSKLMSGTHANWAQLAGYDSADSAKLSPDTKAKMWLSHYQDFKLQNIDMYGNPIDWDAEATKEGFAGFLQQGQEFDL